MAALNPHLPEADITGIEAAALRIGGNIATQGARSWLQRRAAKTERNSSLAKLAAAQINGPLQKHKLDSLVTQITSDVAEQLTPLLEQEFGGLPTHDVQAAVLAVEDVLTSADLSDEAIWEADADPELLAGHLRKAFPRQAESAILSADATALYNRALDLACRYLIHVVRHLSSFPGRAIPEVLARLSGQHDQLVELLSRTPRSTLLAPTGTDRDEDFRRRYAAEIAARLNRLELLGIPTVDQPTLALTVAYLSLTCSDADTTGRLSTRSRFSDPHWSEPFESARGAEGVSVEMAIGRTARVLLRGDAGSGKTTLLSWLAVQAARRQFEGDLSDWNGLVPFVVTLRSHVDGRYPRPEELPEQSAPNVATLMPEGWVHRQFEAGRALLLVDGVDEVEPKHRRKVKTWLQGLLDSYPDLRVVVTSRPAAADPLHLAKEGFTSITLEPMNRASIQAFIERWHSAASAASPQVDAHDRHRKMLRQLERPHIRELATSPLLCAMLCALHFAHRGDLPDNRMDIYDQALTMLMHLRDSERQVPGLRDRSTKEILLRDLAWRHTLAGRVEFRRDDAVGHVRLRLRAVPGANDDPEEILTHLIERSGILRSPAQDRLDFVHRTFQEYLSAAEAVQQDHIGTLISHAHLDTWAQTIVLACGHANDIQKVKLLNGILDRSEAETGAAKRRGLRLLAAQCLETVGHLEPDVLRRTELVIKEHLVPPRSSNATYSLASVGHHILRYLPTTLEGLSAAQAAATVRSAALTGSTKAIPLLAAYAADPRHPVQRELVECWEYFDPDLYADEVLADAPLCDGELTVSHQRFLPLLPRLQHVQNLDVTLDGNSVTGAFDLTCLDNAQNLVRLQIHDATTADVDLAPLAEHHQLEDVWLNVRGHSNAQVLSRLNNLRTLGLRSTNSTELAFLLDLPMLQLLSLAPFADENSAQHVSSLGNLTLLEVADFTSSALRSVHNSPVSRLMLAQPRQDLSLAGLHDIFPMMRDLRLVEFPVFPLADLRGIPLSHLGLYFVSDVDLWPLRDIATLRHLHLGYNPDRSRPTDLAPLADRQITLSIARNGHYLGLDELSESVTVKTY